MKALKAWGEKRNRLIAMFAQQVAVSAKMWFELLVKRAEPSFPMTRPPGDISSVKWLQLYRAPLNLEDALLTFLHAPENIDRSRQDVRNWQSERQNMFSGLIDRIQRVYKSRHRRKLTKLSEWRIEKYYQEFHLPMLAKMLREEGTYPANTEAWINRTELVFFMRVVVPCWFAHGRTPWQLLIDARRGNFDSLEKLVAIDPQVLSLPCFQQSRLRDRFVAPERDRLLRQAASRSIKPPTSLKEIKYVLGGMLMKWSRDFDEIARGIHVLDAIESQLPLAAPQVREQLRRWLISERRRVERLSPHARLMTPDICSLFDAVTQDTTGELRDPDFVGQPNSIYRRLDRNSELFQSLRKADIFRAA